MILWFSGTGNSRHVAGRLGEILGEEVRFMRPEMKTNGERLIFVFPIYSWGVPPYVRTVIGSLSAPAATRCHLVCTCGDDIGLAHRMWRADIARRGWTAVGTYSVQMPNNYVCMKGFDVDSPELAARKISAAEERIARVAEAISREETADDVVTGSWAWVKTRIIYPWFVRHDMSPRRFRATEDCISCGRCVKACPLSNIAFNAERRPEWGSYCAFCLACYHVCPQHAVAYGRATLRKGQYLFPGD